MDKIIKVLNFEVKEVAPRVLEFVGSSEAVDREGDIIMANGWSLANYKKNPVFMWAHNYSEPPIGKAIKVWAGDGQLRFHIKFAEPHEYEFADTIYKLYKGGYLRASSVGFLPIKSEPLETKEDEEDMIFWHQPTRYLKQELLELSGCPVPANPEALAEAKAKGLLKGVGPIMILRGEPVIPLDVLEGLATIEPDGPVLRPYPNEHACRLRDPKDFEEGSFKRTEREHEGKKYSIIMGKLEGETTMTEQAYRYNKEIWTASEAKSHCKEHDGTFEPASEEEVNDAEEGAIEVLDDLNKQKDKLEREVSQETIADEIDFLRYGVEMEGLNKANMEGAWQLVRAMIDWNETREPGSDIPDDIAEKIGAVLNKVNRERLEKIQELAQAVLDSAEKPEEESGEPPDPEKSQLSAERVAQIFAEAMSAAIDKAKGKLRR